jgi:hypothetical protein
VYTYYTLTLFKGFYLVYRGFVYRGFIHCTFVGPIAWHPTSGHILCRAIPLSTYCLCSCKYYVIFGLFLDVVCTVSWCCSMYCLMVSVPVSVVLFYLSVLVSSTPFVPNCKLFWLFHVHSFCYAPRYV